MGRYAPTAVVIHRQSNWSDGSFTAEMDIDAELYPQVQRVAEIQHCEVGDVIEKALRYYIEELGDLGLDYEEDEEDDD